MRSRLVVGATGQIVLDKLWNEDTQRYLVGDEATVTATLYGPDGEAIAGMEDVEMEYVLGQEGRYAATIPDTVTDTLNVGDVLEVIATVEMPSGARMLFVDAVRMAATGIAHEE